MPHRHAFRRNVCALVDRQLSGVVEPSCRRHCRRAVSRPCPRTGRCHHRGLGRPGMNDIELLKAELDKQRSTVALLEAELAETNKGVLALYAELDDNAAQ